MTAETLLSARFLKWVELVLRNSDFGTDFSPEECDLMAKAYLANVDPFEVATALGDQRPIPWDIKWTYQPK